MSRRGARHSTTGVSLFPFLAVLICTIGALILILVSLSQQARQQIVETAPAQAAAETDDVRAEAEVLEWRIEQWQATKATTEQQLGERRLTLSQIEDHTRRLRDEAASLLRAVEELDRTMSANEQPAITPDELARLQAEIASATAELEQRSQKPKEPSSYAVIPYQGPNQTRRRPMYIECRANAIILQPENVRLEESDFRAGLGPGNPLASALRAVREHLLRIRNSNLSEPGEPYPLLIVRPSGIGSYYVAQAALKSWGSEFGYELVDEDWKLEYWAANPELAAIETRAVQEARERQRVLVQAAPRRFRPGSQPSFSMEPPSGNGRGGARGRYAGGGGGSQGSGTGDPNGGGGADNPYAGLAAAGTPGGNGMPPGGSPGYQASGGERAFGGLPGSGNGGGFGPEGQPGATRVPGSAPGNGQLASQSSGGTTGGGQFESGAGGPAIGGDTYQGSVSGGAQAGNGQFGNGQPSGGQSAGGQLGEGRFGGGPAGNGGTGSGHVGGGQIAGGQFGGGQPGGGSGGNGGTGGGQAGSGQGGGGQGGIGQTGGGLASGGQDAQGSPGQGMQRQAMGGQPLNGGGSPFQGMASAYPGDSSSTGGPSVPIRPGEFHPREKREPRSLAERRGGNWALPDATDKAFPISRPIRIVCNDDHLTILPDGKGPKDGRTIPLGAETGAAVDELVSSVWDHMKGWGIAGQGLYWKPILVMEVTPSAGERYADLRALLNNSGLEIHDKPAGQPIKR